MLCVPAPANMQEQELRRQVVEARQAAEDRERELRMVAGRVRARPRSPGNPSCAFLVIGLVGGSLLSNHTHVPACSLAPEAENVQQLLRRGAACVVRCETSKTPWRRCRLTRTPDGPTSSGCRSDAWQPPHAPPLRLLLPCCRSAVGRACCLTRAGGRAGCPLPFPVVAPCDPVPCPSRALACAARLTRAASPCDVVLCAPQTVVDENRELQEQLGTALAALKKARDREAAAAGAIHGQVTGPGG